MQQGLETCRTMKTQIDQQLGEASLDFKLLIFGASQRLAELLRGQEICSSYAARSKQPVPSPGHLTDASKVAIGRNEIPCNHVLQRRVKVNISQRRKEEKRRENNATTTINKM